MSKYEPLGDFLRSQYGDEVRVRFADIEKVLGFPLPASARSHRPWWSNNPDNSAITKVWLKAGFRTEQVDMAGEMLVFAPAKKEASMAAGFGEADAALPVVAGKPLPPHPAFGAMKGMITIMPGVDLTAPADPEWADMLDDPHGRPRASSTWCAGDTTRRATRPTSTATKPRAPAARPTRRRRRSTEWSGCWRRWACRQLGGNNCLGRAPDGRQDEADDRRC